MISWTFGIMFLKLFWPSVREKKSSDQEKMLKFEAEGRKFAKWIILYTSWGKMTHCAMADQKEYLFVSLGKESQRKTFPGNGESDGFWTWQHSQYFRIGLRWLGLPPGNKVILYKSCCELFSWNIIWDLDITFCIMIHEHDLSNHNPGVNYVSCMHSK